MLLAAAVSHVNPAGGPVRMALGVERPPGALRPVLPGSGESRLVSGARRRGRGVERMNK